MVKKVHLRKIIKKPTGEKVFLGFVYGFLIFLTLLIIIPLLNLVAFAFSNENANAMVTFLPQQPTMQYFQYVLTEDPIFWSSLGNSLLMTLVVTLTSNILMAMAAYPLSKDDLPFKKGVLTFFVITMLFGAGIIPTYFMLNTLGLKDGAALWGVIILSINNIFNMLLYKSFFEGLPRETIEAAQVDGVSNIQLFFRIVVPMALPVFASCCFFTIVGTWNSYSSALMFIGQTNDSQWPLAYYIYNLLQTDTSTPGSVINTNNLINISSAAIIISVIPILIIYPFVIKYIKSGITLGSEK